MAIELKKPRNMPKIEQRLIEAREDVIFYLWKRTYSAEDIGIIVSLSTTAVYRIIKEHEGK